MSAMSKGLESGNACLALGVCDFPPGEFSKAWAAPIEILIQLFFEALDQYFL